MADEQYIYQKRRIKMKAAWKRFMAVLMIVSLVLGFCPDVAEAEEAAQDLPVQAVMTEEREEESGQAVTEAAADGGTTEAATEAAAEEGSTEAATEAAAEGETTETEASTEAQADMEEEKEEASGTEETPAAEPEREQPEEDRSLSLPVYTLYCLEDTKIYEQADTASTVQSRLEKGEAFTVTAETDAWYQVIYKEKQGFIEKKEGAFTRERPQRQADILKEDEEEMEALFAGSSNMIYSDGSWSGGTIWYVNDPKKHYIFCLNKGATMYAGKYRGVITTGYKGYDAFRIAAALNYFKKMNGGYGKKDHYGEVQNAIWNTGSSGLLTYIKHAWKLAGNNGSRKAGSSSYDSRLKAAGADSTGSMVAGLKAQKLSASNGVIDKTISLSGSAWKYFAKGEFPGKGGSISTGSGSSGITVEAVYDKDGKEVSFDKSSNYVGTDGKLHIKLVQDTKTQFGTDKNPATILMRVHFPYEGADRIRYLQTAAGKQNLTYDTSADTIGYFAIKIYAREDIETPKLRINKVDEYGSPVSGCTFRVKGTAGDALAKGYYDEKVVNSAEDVFEIEDAGTYTVEETAVPDNGEYKRNTDVMTFTAEWRDVDPDAGVGVRPAPGANVVRKLVLEYNALSIPLWSGWSAETDGSTLTFTCTNESREGAASLTKYGNMLVSYRDGKFVYEKKALEGAEFAFYAEEDIYCGDTLVFPAGTKLTDGMGWGKLLLPGSGNVRPSYQHTVEISGSRTDREGKLTISGLPAGDYYAVETKTVEGFEETTERFSFTVVPDQTVPIRGTEGIINEASPAVCHVFKVDADSKEPLDGAGFTLYADVANTNFKGKPLFTTADTVPAVTARNLSTGEETKESGKWVPLQTATTGDGGMAEFDELPRGRYLVVETKAPVMADGRAYALAEESYVFVHNGKNNAGSNGYNFEHTFEDTRLYKGSIKVIKTDGTTKYPLEGVKFQLLDQDKQVLGTFTTDAQGEILIENLPVGIYYLKETAALEGYRLDDREIMTEITKDDLHQTVEVENQRYGTSITIRPNTSVGGHGGVQTGDSGLFALITGFFLMMAAMAAVLAATAWICHRKAGRKTDRKTGRNGIRKAVKRIWNREDVRQAVSVSGFVLVLSGSLILCLSAHAKLQTGKELSNVEYGGKVYAYALEKELELQEEDTDVWSYFEQVVNGMELKEISCKTVDTVKKTETRTLKESRDYKELTDKDEAKIADTLEVNGETYQLSDITWSEKPNMEHLDYTLSYGYRTEAPEPAQTYEYTYISPVTKKENTATLPFVKLETGDTRWVDGFSAIVTLHNLDGEYFTLGGKEFAYDKDSISFSASGYEELIRMLGHDPGRYRLTGAKWQGKEYKDKKGIRCRDAYVSGQQYAASYQALYEGDVENGSLYTAHATYTLEKEVVSDEVEAYVVRATGYYEKTGVWKNVITFITNHPGASVTAAVLLIALLAGGTIFLVVWKCRKSKQKSGGGDDKGN